MVTMIGIGGDIRGKQLKKIISNFSILDWRIALGLAVEASD